MIVLPYRIFNRAVDCSFELVMVDSGEPFNDAVAAGCISCLVADVVNGGLLNTSVKNCRPSIFGVEGRTLDLWNRELIQVSSANLSRAAAV